MSQENEKEGWWYDYIYGAFVLVILLSLCVMGIISLIDQEPEILDEYSYEPDYATEYRVDGLAERIKELEELNKKESCEDKGGKFSIEEPTEENQYYSDRSVCKIGSAEYWYGGYKEEDGWYKVVEL